MKKIPGLLFCCFSLLIMLSACQMGYSDEYIEWGEQTNSNTTELLEENEIPYKINNEMIYIPEDAFDDAIFCCS
ncbi:hypothetical protein ACW2QC_19785 [Virgibacillus sp. FSP13]